MQIVSNKSDMRFRLAVKEDDNLSKLDFSSLFCRRFTQSQSLAFIPLFTVAI